MKKLRGIIVEISSEEELTKVLMVLRKDGITDTINWREYFRWLYVHRDGYLGFDSDKHDTPPCHRSYTRMSVADVLATAAWQPKVGEVVLASNNAAWHERVYLATLESGLSICAYKNKMPTKNEAVACYAWLNIKQKPTMKEISFDGKVVEVSEESFEALRKFFKESS